MAKEIIEQDKDFLFYTSNDGTTNIQVIVQDETIWTTQKAMSEIFDVNVPAISKHLTNIFFEGELDYHSTVSKMEIVQMEGGRDVTRNADHYNLDAVIAVGYRVNSFKATQFRIWATKVLKEYLVKGFAMDDERLKQGKTLFGKDYFDELLERIRDIRASERRFYQKVTDLYIQCSYDYNASSPTTHEFFAHAQNKVEYAVTGMTAAQIVKERASHNLPHMGLTTWSGQGTGGKITQRDVTVAKNYLAESEISDLNRLVNMFLDFAENLAKKGKKMAMVDWHEKLDSFLRFNEYQVLQNYGVIKKDLADKLAINEYKKLKPIQDKEYMSDFDKAVETIKTTGSLPKEIRDKLNTEISNFDKKLKKALDYNQKEAE